jgi:hypothetical protein
MTSSLRATIVASLSGLRLLLGISSSTTATALPSAAAPISYYSLMSASDHRAVSPHQFYPTWNGAFAEAYEGTSRMQWGLMPRAGASDALLVNRQNGMCLSASGEYAVLAACTSAATQGWSFIYPPGPDHIEAPYGVRSTSTQKVLTVGPDNWGGTPIQLYPDYGASWQRFWLDWRYSG